VPWFGTPSTTFLIYLFFFLISQVFFITFSRADRGKNKRKQNKQTNKKNTQKSKKKKQKNRPVTENST
jgi:hypothetical protein